MGGAGADTLRIVATSPGSDWGLEEETVRSAGGGEIAFVSVPAVTEDELIAAGREADAILAGNERFTPRVLEEYGRAGRVRAISRPAVGFDQEIMKA